MVLSASQFEITLKMYAAEDSMTIREESSHKVTITEAQRRPSSNPVLGIEIEAAQNLHSDRSGEIPNKLIEDLKEQREEEKKQVRDSNDENLPRDYRDAGQNVDEGSVGNAQYSARLPSPDLADGQVSTMPSITIDACADERKNKKTMFLNKSGKGVLAAPVEGVTARLS